MFYLMVQRDSLVCDACIKAYFKYARIAIRCTQRTHTNKWITCEKKSSFQWKIRFRKFIVSFKLFDQIPFDGIYCSNEANLPGEHTHRKLPKKLMHSEFGEQPPLSETSHSLTSSQLPAAFKRNPFGQSHLYDPMVLMHLLSHP